MIEKPLWSVLIATLASRQGMLATLLARLLPQCETDGRVEVLACYDNGEHSVGAKRAALLAQAAGVYVSYVDDDDQVDGEYVRLITAVMGAGMDLIAFDHNYYVDGRLSSLIKVGLHQDPEDRSGMVRRVTHINPVRRALTAGAGFFAPGHGEDWAFVTALIPRIATQAVACEDRPLYHYYHRPHDSAQRVLAPHTGQARLQVDSPCFRWIEVP